MGLEGKGSGERRRDAPVEYETCPKCHGKGTTGDSPDNIRICSKCDGKGKIKTPTT